MSNFFVGQKEKAKQFASEWLARLNTGKKLSERSFAQPYWQELLGVLYIKDITKQITFEQPVHLDGAHLGSIDGYIRQTQVLIEHKSSNVDLSRALPQSDGQTLTPYQQGLRYAQHLPSGQPVRYIVLCNFKEFWIYDLDQNRRTPEAIKPVIIKLDEFEQQFPRLRFMVDPTMLDYRYPILPLRESLSLEAAIRVADLRAKLHDLYQDTEPSLVKQSLNKLCVRLVFCFYADDAGLFRDQDGNKLFQSYLDSFPIYWWHWALLHLFQILDTPLAQRPKNERPQLLAFPYVDGGLFEVNANDLIPLFTDEVGPYILYTIGAGFKWSDIAPTIFGEIFESAFAPDSRRASGMYYTALENIHRVIDPLCLDELHNELSSIQQINEPEIRASKLILFQDKLTRLTFFDPACGSGNFLTETYLSLRRLENEVIQELHQVNGPIAEYNPVKISINQFYGIESDSFAVSIAKTALWIASTQMQQETNAIVGQQFESFPLQSYDNIFEGNALTTSWEQVVPFNKLKFIIGNPPYSGARIMTPENKEALRSALGPNWPSNSGDLDLVCGWIKKAHDAMAQFPNIKTAFLATNSICQGTSPNNLWAPLFKQGTEIIFARQSFLWDNEAAEPAQVFCVVLGIANQACPNKGTKLIFNGKSATPAHNINAYLVDGDDMFIAERRKPLCHVPEGSMGNQLIDNGNYLFTQEEKDRFLALEPQAAPYFYRWFGAEELLQGKIRYCMYLGKCSEDDLTQMPLVLNLVEKVRSYRCNSLRANTIKLAMYPMHFETTFIPETPFLAIPVVSSSRREYIPIGFMQPNEGLCSQMIKIISNVGLYHFGIITSIVHMIWLKMVGGRLKMDYRYSTELVYNTFPWPQNVATKLHKQIEKAAQAILDARAQEKGATLAQLYDPIMMPPALRQAHKANDCLVMSAYGFALNLNEDQIFAKLYKIYQQLSTDEAAKTQAKKNK
ncbi:MAG: DNA methyltransferase [Anaerobiospirillum sp.]|nr:DNA methyltransferase [Anaerobiospirillum sp.]